LRLRPLEELTAEEVGLEELLNSMRSMLRSNSVASSLAVKGNRVIDGDADYWALRWLRCRLAPVSEGLREGGPVPLEALGFYDNAVSNEYRAYRDVMELLSNDRPTPMVMLRGDWGPGVRVWAKLEWYNPLSLSIKDRTALGVLTEALSRNPNARKIFEVSSSNTGIALAALSAALGLRARIYVPTTAEDFGPSMLRVLGAEVVVRGSSTVEALPSAIEEARAEGAIMPNQFENIANPLMHVGTTAKEIDLQANFLGLKLRGIFVTLGTRGHSAGIAFYFKNRRPDVKVFGVQPAEGSIIPGIRRQDPSRWWPMAERPDEIIDVTDSEAIDSAIAVARTNGLLFGMSGGAAVAALLKKGKLEEGDYVLVVPDHGIKYLDRYLSRLGNEGVVGGGHQGSR
jgi:cysteine synthase/O-phosphoserine sulfhydrylase/cystathionine beta-synthase